jgi:hypothetical protein
VVTLGYQQNYKTSSFIHDFLAGNCVTFGWDFFRSGEGNLLGFRVTDTFLKLGSPISFKIKIVSFQSRGKNRRSSRNHQE